MRRAVAGLIAAPLACVLVALTSHAQAPARPGAIVVAGSGSNLAGVRLLVDAFVKARPDVVIDVPSSIGSTGGVRAAAEGAIAVGLVSRPLKEDEQKLGLTYMPYARTAVVLAVHPGVADDGLTTEELVQVYEGKKARWRDGRDIVVLTREPGDSSIEVLQRVVPGFKQAYTESQSTKRWKTYFTDQEMANAVVRTPYALGLSDTGAVNGDQLPLKTLKINGTVPTRDSVASGKYPLVKTLAFVYRPQTLPPNAKAFLDFVRSADGMRALTANGYFPASGS